MSNYEAGKLYESVIEEVITDSRQDFEDSGIDETTLQELKKLWSEKLSQSRVCKLAWDDEESNRNLHQGLLGDTHLRADNLQISNGLELPTAGAYDSSVPTQTNVLSGNVNGAYNMGIELPIIKHEYADDSGLMLPKINQGDGAFEFTVNADTETARGLLKRAQSLIENGLSQADGGNDDGELFNGSDDINSDLDDDLDSENSDDEDIDQEGQIMLCLYDKVQRVKNKWKCNLKEGVANINGRDYVFQRATGESEW